jgi:hypothetical protein
VPDPSRRSHALVSFSQYLHGREPLHILDFGPASQANLDYVTGFGHRLYAEDLLHTLDNFFTPEETAAGKLSDVRIEDFLNATLGFADMSTDGALLWDTIQFLPPELVQPFVDRLYRILAPDSCLFVLFHPETAHDVASPHWGRVLDGSALLLKPRARRRQLMSFNNRSIERLFHRFQSVKFFLTREHLREVFVRR